MMNSTQLLSQHQKIWAQIQHSVKNKKIPQALLLVGTADSGITPLINRFTALSLCLKQASEPCLQCKECIMIIEGTHPDIQWVQPEKAGGALKIEQIRGLQSQIFKTSQRAQLKFFILHSIERMSKSVANSLLKILEEPPARTHFILVAEHLSTVLPTITSRCQLWRLSGAPHQGSLLSLIEGFPEESEQSKIAEHTALIIDSLKALLTKESIPTVIATQLKTFEFKHLLWMLYLIYAELIKLRITKQKASGPYSSQLNALLNWVKPVILFEQLSKITLLQRKISHNRVINPTLALEDLFIHLI